MYVSNTVCTDGWRRWTFQRHWRETAVLEAPAGKAWERRWSRESPPTVRPPGPSAPLQKQRTASVSWNQTSDQTDFGFRLICYTRTASCCRRRSERSIQPFESREKSRDCYRTWTVSAPHYRDRLCVVVSGSRPGFRSLCRSRPHPDLNTASEASKQTNTPVYQSLG